MEKKYGESLPAFEVLLNAQSSDDLYLPPLTVNSMENLGGRRSPKDHLNSLIKQISSEPEIERSKEPRYQTY